MIKKLQMRVPRLLLLAASFACMALVAGCGGGKDRPLVVGTEAQFPPFEFKDTGGNLTGFDIDLIKAIAEKIGRKVELRDMQFAGIIPALQSGQIDMAIAGMSVTEERKKSILFSDPYIDAGLVILVGANNSTIKGSGDLVGKKAAVHLGSTGAKQADELKAAGKLGTVNYYNSSTLAIMELAKGGADCVIIDKPYAETFVSKEPGKVNILPEVLASDSYAVAFNLKSTELQTEVNKALAALTADGTIDKIKAKYFAAP